MSIEIRHIHKHFGAFQALTDVNLQIASGELVALLGPSGCGKTTLLRIMAGLEGADDGQVAFHGEDMTHVHVRERRVGFVFQHYALFRHMSVFDNVAFGLRMRPRASRPGEAQIREQVHHLLERVQLNGLSERHPAQLSGGQRQRVALARAEPNSSLDEAGERALQNAVVAMKKRGTTFVINTHRTGLLAVADLMLVLQEGVVQIMGPVTEVLAKIQAAQAQTQVQTQVQAQPA